MGMFGKKKEPEIFKAGDTIETEKISLDEVNKTLVKRNVVVKDVSEEFSSFRAEVAETFVTKEDAAAETMGLHQKIDNVIAYLKSQQQQPKL